MMLVIGITEVLEASTASGLAWASTVAKIFCFSSRFSSAASTTKSAWATASPRSAQGVMRSTAVGSSPRSRRLVAMRSRRESRLG